MSQPTILRGVVQGNTVVLQSSTGLPDGQEVTVQLAAAPAPAETNKPNGLEASFGGWDDDPEGVDEFIKWTREQRRVPGRKPGL